MGVFNRQINTLYLTHSRISTMIVFENAYSKENRGATFHPNSEAG